MGNSSNDGSVGHLDDGLGDRLGDGLADGNALGDSLGDGAVDELEDCPFYYPTDD